MEVLYVSTDVEVDLLSSSSDRVNRKTGLRCVLLCLFFGGAYLLCLGVDSLYAVSKFAFFPLSLCEELVPHVKKFCCKSRNLGGGKRAKNATFVESSWRDGVQLGCTSC